MFIKGAFNAMPKNHFDLKKNFWLSAIGIRSDGVEVFSKNQATNVGVFKQEKLKTHQKIFCSHAECRVLRKMDFGGILFVTRIGKDFTNDDFTFKMARPCELCFQQIKSKKIEKVYYTINNDTYGILLPEKDKDYILPL